MAVRFVRLAILTFGLGAVAILAACNNETESSPSEQDATSTAPLESDPAEPPISDAGSPAGLLPEGQSLRGMVEFHRNVLVGDVVREAGVDYSLGETSPKTLFEVAVSEVIAGDEVEPGDRITLLISGGPFREEGRMTWEGTSFVPLQGAVEPGKRYLMFVSDGRIAGYPGFFGDYGARFELTDDDRLIPNAAERYPAGDDWPGPPKNKPMPPGTRPSETPL